jgi:hypothetical protein
MKLPLHSSKTCAGRKLLYHDNFLSFYFSFLMVAFGVSFFWMSILQVVLWPLLLKMLVVEKYTGAVSTVCRCISELVRRKLARGESIFVDYTSNTDIPRPEEVLARLLVLLQDPMAREQLGSRILTVLYYIGPLFPPAVVLLWEDEVCAIPEIV